VTNRIYIWGSVYSNLKETYKINEPKLLVQKENESDFEKRYLKIECGSQDLYFLDSKYEINSINFMVYLKIKG